MSDRRGLRLQTTAKDSLVTPLVYGEPISSILIVKLDHIGDFFLALPGMRRLREAFPQSRITLVCGPWNKALASSLGLFDEVISFSFFPEQTRDLQNRRNQAHRQVEIHRLFASAVGGPYDLAVDLRYDSDTRRLLTMVQARHRVGIGDTNEFPFLDVSLPSDRLRARPDQPDREISRSEAPFSPAGAQQIRVGLARPVLRFDLDAPASPSETGLSFDKRLLGLALHKLKLTRAYPLAVGFYPCDHPVWEGSAENADRILLLEQTCTFKKDAPGAVDLEFGFSEPESFGVWTDGYSAQFSAPMAAGLNPNLRLCLQIEGYVAPDHRPQSFDFSCNGVKLCRGVLGRDDGVRTLIVPIDRDILSAGERLASAGPFVIEAGEATIRVDLQPLGAPDLSGRSRLLIEVVNSVGRVLGRRALAGASLALAVANDIAFVQDDPGSEVSVTVKVFGEPFEGGLDLLGAQVISSTRKSAPRLHILDWAGLLCDMIVRRFAPEPDVLRLPPASLPDDLHRRLATDRTAGRKIVVIATGANKDITKWLPSHFSAFAGMLIDALPCTIYLVGTAREKAEAQAVIDDNGGVERIVNICGATNLAQLGTLLKKADLFIGGSTGTTHAAAMVGTPTLALLSAANHPHQWAPAGVNASFLSLDVPCRQCHILFMSQCKHGYRCMVDLTPQMVFERAMQMLAAAPERAAQHQATARR